MSMAVGTTIRRLREARGLTSRELAAKLEAGGRRMDPSVVTRIELGRHVPQGSLRALTVDELVAFAAALGVTSEWLLRGPKCSTCLDMPPHGFACKTCGADA